jgi:hypothetical protein
MTPEDTRARELVAAQEKAAKLRLQADLPRVWAAARCRTDRAGNVAHWILEVHLVDREREIGGFFEQLLTLP